MNKIYFKTQNAFNAKVEQLGNVPGTTTVVSPFKPLNNETQTALIFTNGELVAKLVMSEMEFYNAPIIERGEETPNPTPKEAALEQLRAWLFDNRMRCIGNNMEAKTEVWATTNNELLLVEDTGENFRLWRSIPFMDLEGALEALEAHFEFNQMHF